MPPLSEVARISMSDCMPTRYTRPKPSLLFVLLVMRTLHTDQENTQLTSRTDFALIIEREAKKHRKKKKKWKKSFPGGNPALSY